MKKLINRINDNKKFSTSSFPKNMLIEVTNNCNHKCIFCYNRKMSRKRQFIKSEFVDRILKEAYALGTREVGFYTTGEPIMCKELDQYIRKAKQIGYEYVYITTNGVLLTKEVALKLVQNGIDSIKFSINAGNKKSYRIIHGKDDFNKVLQNIRDLYRIKQMHNKKLKIFSSFVRTSITYNEAKLLERKIGKYMDEMVCFDVYNQGGSMYEINKELSINTDERPMKAPCAMVFNRIHITCEGFLSICCVDFENNLAVSDLNTVSLKEAWECNDFRDIRERHMLNDLEGTLCYNCINNCNKQVEPLNVELSTKHCSDLEQEINMISYRIRRQ